jgi:hypothetical protein
MRTILFGTVLWVGALLAGTEAAEADPYPTTLVASGLFEDVGWHGNYDKRYAYPPHPYYYRPRGVYWYRGAPGYPYFAPYAFPHYPPYPPGEPTRRFH